jgi:hypothetical protein
MRPSAAAFQERVTGVRAGGHTYRVDGVEFDGVRVDAGGRATLLEAKDNYAQFLKPPKPTTQFPNWDTVVLNKVTRQARTADRLGLPLEIHCAQRDVAARLKSDLNAFKNLKIIWNGEEQ